MEQKLKLNPSEETHLRLRSICEGSSTFGDAVQRLVKDESMSEGKAILVARKHAGGLYTQWCQAGRPDIRLIGR
jgi:hypothetical protein